MLTFFQMKIVNGKRRFRYYEYPSTIFKINDTFVIIATKLSFVAKSIMYFGFLVIPISTGIACGLTNTDKVIFEIIKKYNKYGKQYGKSQQTLNSLDKRFGKCLPGKVFDENEYDF